MGYQQNPRYFGSFLGSEMDFAGFKPDLPVFGEGVSFGICPRAVFRFTESSFPPWMLLKARRSVQGSVHLIFF